MEDILNKSKILSVEKAFQLVIGQSPLYSQTVKFHAVVQIRISLRILHFHKSSGNGRPEYP
jgi:hypothetical protein